MPHLPLQEGLFFLSSLGSVLIGLSVAEKRGLKVNSKAVLIALQILLWGGIFILFGLKNPIWKWL